MVTKEYKYLLKLLNIYDSTGESEYLEKAICFGKTMYKKSELAEQRELEKKIKEMFKQGIKTEKIAKKLDVKHYVVWKITHK